MKMYPGNESEKPVIRNIIDDLKQRNHISGRTVQVADKGLNCLNNIRHALKAGDGYIFSKNNIKIQNGKPVWGKDCTHCMACICHCPTEAIEYGKKSVGSRGIIIHNRIVIVKEIYYTVKENKNSN